MEEPQVQQEYELRNWRDIYDRNKKARLEKKKATYERERQKNAAKIVATDKVTAARTVTTIIDDLLGTVWMLGHSVDARSGSILDNHNAPRNTTLESGGGIPNEGNDKGLRVRHETPDYKPLRQVWAQ